MPLTPSRALATVATAVALSLLGTTMAGAGPELPPGVTLPPRASDTTTTTTAPIEPVPDPAPAPAPAPAAPAPDPAPAPAPSPAPGPETKLIPVGPSHETRILDGPVPGSSATTIIKPGDPSAPGTAQPPSLSPGQVDEVLRNLQRSGASSTSALIEALRPLQNLGMTTHEALALGMGQFPVLGLTHWTDDWLDPRSGPPVHQHQGNDLFAPFDTPVRAPVNGIVTFQDAGLGGKGAFVTAPDGTYYYMAHLNGFNADLANGAAVEQGQVIGFNGDSGNAKGGAPHVHFEIHPLGGAAVNPKPILDAWVADAMSRVDELIESFQPKSGSSAGVGVPQILVATGLTRRFSAPSLPVPGRERQSADFNQAVLGPLTPAALAPMFDQGRTERRGSVEGHRGELGDLGQRVSGTDAAHGA